jgi:hypothetical protein
VVNRLNRPLDHPGGSVSGFLSHLTHLNLAGFRFGQHIPLSSRLFTVISCFRIGFKEMTSVVVGGIVLSHQSWPLPAFSTWHILHVEWRVLHISQ